MNLPRPTRGEIAVGVLLLPGLVLTLLRWWAPEQELLLQAVSFAPYAVPLLLVGAAVLGLVWWRVRRDNVVVAAGVVVALALLTQVAWLAPRFVDDGRAVPAGAPRIQVMTLNLELGHADAAAVVEAVRDADPDVLALQEVTPGLLRRLDRAGLERLLPYRAGTPAPGAAGTLLLAVGPIRDVRRIDVRNGAVFGEVTLAEGTLRVYDVHTATPLHGDRWVDDLALLRYTAEHDPEVDLVLGDFNATLDHARFRALLDGGRLEDAAEQVGAGWQLTWPTHGKGVIFGIGTPLVAIDHVLLGRDVQATELAAHDVAGTDHRALVAEVVLR